MDWTIENKRFSNETLERLKIQLLALGGDNSEAALYRRLNGRDWGGYTMIGLRRLDNIQVCIETLIEDGIPGCLVEAGVWRGGACIFMAAVLKEHRDDPGFFSRNVYACDIFEGTFPTSDHPLDRWTGGADFRSLSVYLEEVKENFRDFGLLEDNVIFKDGWFSDTLPTIDEPVALLRIDGDTYSSTIDAMALEPQIPSGGYIIMDDWFIKGSRQAFLDYFSGAVTEKDMTIIDSYGAFWRKP